MNWSCLRGWRLWRSGERKSVELLVVPASDAFQAMIQAAALRASRLVTGISPRMASDELARRIGSAREPLPEPHHPCSLEIISQGRKPTYVNLGPHPPRLWGEDVERLHDMTETEGLGSKLHRRDVLGVALRRLEQELTTPEEKEEEEEEILALIREEMKRA